MRAPGKLQDGSCGPGLVLRRHQLVAEDALALVTPERQQVAGRLRDRTPILRAGGRRFEAVL